MKRSKIFIADGDKDFAWELAKLLTAVDHRVVRACDGEIALRKSGEQFFDVTFMGIKLPDMNGVECFQENRKAGPDIKTIMITGYAAEALRKQAIDAGVLGALEKLFGEEVFDILPEVKPKSIVLLAGDDPDFAVSMNMYLGSAGYSVVHARTGQEVVKEVLADAFDILILDLRVSVLTGFEVCLELKRHQKKLSTIVATGYAAEEAEILGMLEVPFGTDCLVKPLEPAELCGP